MLTWIDQTMQHAMFFVFLLLYIPLPTLHSHYFVVTLTLPFHFLGGLKVTCEYVAHKEGVLSEEMLIVSESKEDVCLKVKVHARVMGELLYLIYRFLSFFQLNYLENQYFIYL